MSGMDDEQPAADPDPASTPNPAGELDPLEAAEIAQQQSVHLRRILVRFLFVVVLLPFVGLGGMWSFALVPLLLVAALALREALALRQSVLRYGMLQRRS
ncbi:MAG: hypothetical protein ABI200_05285 [Gaiellales bacterium]